MRCTSPLKLLVAVWSLTGLALLLPTSATTTTVIADTTDQTIAVSTFDTDTEGWTTDADATCRPTPCYAPTGGNPGGHIYTDDALEGTRFYFNTPPKFLGDVSAAYGQILNFDLRQNNRDTEATNDADVVLVGNNLTLVFDTPTNPPPIWSTYSVPLDATAGWRVGTTSGRPPTEAEMRGVLSNLSALRIRGDYIFGQATTFLDNVILGGTEEPQPTVRYIFLPLVQTQR